MSESNGFAAWWAEYQRVNQSGAAQMYTARAAWDEALEAAQPQRSKLIEIAAELVRGRYMPHHESWKTIRHAREAMPLHQEQLTQLALKLKTIVDELSSLQSRA